MTLFFGISLAWVFVVSGMVGFGAVIELCSQPETEETESEGGRL